MNNQHVTYLRVSSIDQCLSRQEDAMKSVKLDKVFTEKASAKDTNRPVLQECIDYCRAGGLLIAYVTTVNKLYFSKESNSGFL